MGRTLLRSAAGNVWLLQGRIVYGNDHVELRRLLRESRNWLVIGDLPYLPWVNGSQPYFEQTTNRREAVRDDDVLPAFASAMLGRNVAPHFSPQDSPRLATIDAISWPSREFRSTCFSISIRAANSGPIFLFNSAIFSTSALAFFMSFS